MRRAPLTQRRDSRYTPAPMYDTSDLRKGLKVLIDGVPYVVLEAQFVKPGKGAAFTRTKMKNLLYGGNIERQILEDALRISGGNKSAAAEMLGLKRTTLSAKLRSLAVGAS